MRKTIERCATCGLRLALSVAAAMGVNPPRGARCYRDHARHEGCLFGAAIDQCRGNWMGEMLDAMMPEEREQLSREMQEVEKYL